MRTKSRPVPVTLETWNMGQILGREKMSQDDVDKDIYNLLILGINLRNLDSGFDRFNEHWILPEHNF